MPSIGLVDIQEKYNSLKEYLLSCQKVLIAYSGGVDSVFLLKVATDTLGPQNVIACLGTSPSLGKSQHAQALEMAEIIGAPLREIPVTELDDPNYSANKADRCFHCKSHLYGIFTKIAKQEGIEHVLCGANLDDKDDYRPGNRAAEVFKVKSPLIDAGLTKNDIRQLSKELNLKTADLPAAPCLASRITYGLEVTEERLNQIDQAEDYLKSLGLQTLRVRHHGDTARIEVPTQDINKITEENTRKKIVDRLKQIGFKYISLDLQGFRSGALNETLTEQQKRSEQAR
ncbi:MAG: ATP-dependent sacrificial sulfur transferase LarE [Planctomycetes bacterium]|nr:ATP-dependent sacrificial sulfur transferase LarE [Planctomycetota bacterium]